MIGLAAPAVVVPSRPAPSLTVREDPAEPGRLIVSSEGRGTGPLIVTWERRGRSGVAYRSPDPTSFSVCAFIRQVGAAREAGSLDVLLGRGSSSTRVKLDYDGVSCATARPGTAPAPPPKLAPASFPEVAPPPTATPVSAQEPVPISDAKVVSGAVTAGEKWLTFRLLFDRSVAPGEKVTVQGARREQVGGDLLPTSRFTVRRTGPAELSWQVSMMLLEMKTPFVRGERIRASLVFDGTELPEVAFVMADPGR